MGEIKCREHLSDQNRLVLQAQNAQSSSEDYWSLWGKLLQCEAQWLFEWFDEHKKKRWSMCCGLHGHCGLYPTEDLPGSDSGWQHQLCVLFSFDFISYTHLHNAGIMEPVHPALLLKITSLSPHLYHLPICNEKTTDRGPLGVSWQQLYELTRQEKGAMEKWKRERERERDCVEEKRGPFSAEIRWYSPFAQNEFIRGVRDSHCWESRFLCDKGVGATDWREKKSFISCSSEAVTVSGDQQRGWVEGKKEEAGRGQAE